MPFIEYQAKKFRRKSLALIKLCNEIITDLAADGLSLTLRQLYYQLVGRGIIPNNEKSYDNIGALISDARLAGLVDWDAIVDRTRHVRSLPHWNDPSDIVSGAAKQFNYDLWEGQPTRVEVWVEKDALVDVIGNPAAGLDVPFFSCRGYTSQTEMWGAAQRIIDYYERHGAKRVVILHFGDHDPSGIDMTRDIQDRLTMFCQGHFAEPPEIRRLALTIQQVREHKLPPNPAKLTDCRAGKYIEAHGHESWELDAMHPRIISALVRDNLQDLIEDPELFETQQQRQKDARAQLYKISSNYDKIVKHLNKKPKSKKK
jgi:hypothetical protein